MSAQALLDQCLAILYSIKNDRQRLEKLLEFMQQEFSVEEEIDAEETVDLLAQVPVKYHPVVKEIAENMSARLISFVDPETLEVDAVPQMMEYEGIDKQAFTLDWEDRIEIEPLDSHYSYEIMENFVAQLPGNLEKNAYRMPLSVINLLPISIGLFISQSFVKSGSNFNKKNWKNM